MTEFITDPLQFYKRFNGADIDMHDLCLINDDLVELVYKCKHEYAVESKVTNLFIGVFTTAWARLEIYNLCDLIGENVLYVDTDSCMYVSMEHMGYCLIAHNAKGFDAVLIQRWLFQNRPTADMHVIHSGQKMIQLTLKDYEIRLIDSLNFLQMPLSKFPETFGLDLAMQSKGDFPFRYNILANQDYVGPMPSIDFYDIDTKKDVKKTERIYSVAQEIS